MSIHVLEVNGEHGWGWYVRRSSWVGLWAGLPSSSCPGRSIPPPRRKGPLLPSLRESLDTLSHSDFSFNSASSESKLFWALALPKSLCTLQTHVPKGSTLSNTKIEKLQNPKAVDVEPFLWISFGAVHCPAIFKGFRSPFFRICLLSVVICGYVRVCVEETSRWQSHVEGG